ncbi:hypothetical protein ACLOJK_030885 [Asimina triloba]
MGIFEPFRAIGYITAGVPFAVQKLGTETFVTVSVGKAWQIYNVSHSYLFELIFTPRGIDKCSHFSSYGNMRSLASLGHYSNTECNYEVSRQRAIAVEMSFCREQILTDRMLISGQKLIHAVEDNQVRKTDTGTCCLMHNHDEGPQLPKKIRALACHRDFTFAAYGNDIGVFKRTLQVATWSRHDQKIDSLLLFGEHIISIDVKGNMFIWAFKGINEKNLAPVGHIVLEERFTPSCLVHPDTYLNKVLLGSREGSLQLWNISTQKTIYEFKGWDSSVHCCVSSPALDVVAVGCADGKVHLHNLRYDEEITTFVHSTRGAVTALSFRTVSFNLVRDVVHDFESADVQYKEMKLKFRASILLNKFSLYASISMLVQTDSLIWHLEVHQMWIFDTTDGDPRLLRFRSGHSAPPLCIRFDDDDIFLLMRQHVSVFNNIHDS